MLEHAGVSFREEDLEEETASELTRALQRPEVRYLDFFTGSFDHDAHATTDPAALYQVLRRLDTLADCRRAVGNGFGRLLKSCLGCRTGRRVRPRRTRCVPGILHENATHSSCPGVYAR
jgi:hypothetical protein